MPSVPQHENTNGSGAAGESKRLTTRDQLKALKRVNQGVVAGLLGITQRQFANYVDDAPRNADGTYDAQAVVKWWVKRKVDAAKQVPQLDPLTAEKKRIDNALATEKLKVARGSVVSVDDVGHIANRLFGAVRKAISMVQHEYGEKAVEIVNEAIKEAEEDLGARMDSRK